MVTWSTESPRSAILAHISRYVSEYRRYQRTHKRMITSSKCRPRKSAGLFRVTIHRTKSPQPRLQQNRSVDWLGTRNGDGPVASLIYGLRGTGRRASDRRSIRPRRRHVLSGVLQISWSELR